MISSLDHELYENFRPVSNLRLLTKGTENVVATRLIAHLQNNNLFEPFQSACKQLVQFLMKLCHLKSTVSAILPFFYLRNISRIKKYLLRAATECLMRDFVTSKLDSYNSLLYGLYSIQNLQNVLNAAARFLTYTSRYDHIFPVVAELHWLPIEKRIIFKSLLLTCKAIYGPYLSPYLNFPTLGTLQTLPNLTIIECTPSQDSLLQSQ